MYRAADGDKKSTPNEEGRGGQSDAKSVAKRGGNREPQKGEEGAVHGRASEDRDNAIIATHPAKQAGGSATKTPGCTPSVEPNKH